MNSTRLDEVRQLAGGETVRADHDYRKLLADDDVNALHQSLGSAEKGKTQ